METTFRNNERQAKKTVVFLVLRRRMKYKRRKHRV